MKEKPSDQSPELTRALMTGAGHAADIDRIAAAGRYRTARVSSGVSPEQRRFAPPPLNETQIPQILSRRASLTYGRRLKGDGRSSS
jgi:hypothetical protein